MEYAQLGIDFRIAERELGLLNDPENPDAWRKLTEKLGSGTEDCKILSRHLFGSETPPPDANKITKQWKQNPALASSEAAEMYKSIIAKRMADINETRQTMYAHYMAGIHEREAWYIGQLAKEQAKSLKRAATPGDSGDYFDLACC